MWRRRSVVCLLWLFLPAAAVPLHSLRSGLTSLAGAEDPIHVARVTDDPKEREAGGAGGLDLEKHVHEIRKSAAETLGKVEKVDVGSTVKVDADMLMEVFLPGLRFRPDILAVLVVILLCAFVWFAVYYISMYKTDRSEDLSRWGMTEADLDEGGTSGEQLKPDLVIVFPHPGYKDPGHKAQATHKVMRRTMVSEVNTWRVVAPEGEVAVRRAPDAASPQIGTKRAGEVLKGQSDEHGWVWLTDEIGFVSIAVEEDPDEGVPHDGYPAPSMEEGQPRQAALEIDNGRIHYNFARFHRLMKDAMTWEAAMTPMTHLRRAEMALHRSSSEVDHHHGEVPDMVTRGAARVALIQDLYDSLPRWGFDLALFSSIDDDELYLCISLRDETAQSSYLRRQSASLRVRKDVVRKLGILQPPEEHTSSPPKVRFDLRTVSHLHECGVLQKDDPREFYETYHGRDQRGCIVSGKERFRMIFRELCSHVDLDAAKSDGLIVDWYPCHSKLWLKKLDRTWASWHNLCDFSFKQPVCLIQDYFGSRVAFSFAWNGLYCKCLLALSIFAIVVELAGLIAKSEYVAATTVNKRIVLAFSITVTIWARIAHNLWLREQEFFLNLWEMKAEDHQGQNVRPSFVGEHRPSPADNNILEKQYPPHLARYRTLASASITIIFCGFVAMVNLVWYKIFEDNMNVVASIVLALIITIFSAMYDFMVPWLTDWENHKYQSTYYDSFLWKQFLFQCVNRYFAFFQLSVKQRYTAAGCPEQGCLAVIRMQLATTLAILSFTRIFQVILASVIVRFKIWWEDWSLRRSLGSEEEADKRSFIELQCKFGEARLREQIDNMLQLVLALGFVLLFGGVAPITVPLSLAVFMVQLRASAYLLLNYTKRTLPRQQIGIGMWAWLISLLMHVSILFSGFLIAQYGDTFAGMPTITRLAGVVLYVLIMQVICFLVDVIVPQTCPEVEILLERRHRVRQVISRRSEEFTPAGPTSGGSVTSGITAQYAAEVANAEWSKIPHLQAVEHASEG